MKKKIAELTKRLSKCENTNKELIKKLDMKDQLLQEAEEELRLQADKIIEVQQQKAQDDEAEQIEAKLMEENNELKEHIYYLQDAFEEKKTKYKLKIEQLENDLFDLNKYYEQPEQRLSMKRKADFIRLENELRQKNIYIDSLLDKIKELQSSNRDSLSNYRMRLSSRNDTKNSVDISKFSANK